MAVCFFCLYSEAKLWWFKITVRAATGKMKYFTLSPGFPFFFASAEPPFIGWAQVQRVLPWEHTHVNVYTHAHKHTHNTKEETKHQKSRKTKIFGCIWVCVSLHHAVWCSLPPWHGNREFGAECDVTLCWSIFFPFFLLSKTPSNMQAHLSRALKPSLILWRPKYSNFFQQTSSQLALDCQWGSPNS